MSSKVPTVSQRTGDFSGLAIIKDPFTGLPFNNNVIPQQRLNPVAVNLQNALYPLPNRSGIGVNVVDKVPLREHPSWQAARAESGHWGY